MLMADFVSLHDAFKDGLIPEKFRSIFNTTDCKWCGRPLAVNRNLTIVRCNNSKCVIRQAKSLVKVMQNLCIKGLGETKIYDHICKRRVEAAAYDFVKEKVEELGVDLVKLRESCKQGEKRLWDALSKEQQTELHKLSVKIDVSGASFDNTIAAVLRGSVKEPITSPLSFLLDPPAEYAQVIDMALATPRTYAEAVKVLAIPDMVERADLLFGDCDSYDDFKIKIGKYGGFQNFIEQEIAKSKDGKIKKILLQRIIENCVDLHRIPSAFNIVTSKVTKIDVVITGGVIGVTDVDGGHYNKQEFLQALNNDLVKLGIRLVLKKRVSNTTKILVCDGGGTSNLQDALYINEQRKDTTVPPIEICTSSELAAEVAEMLLQSELRGSEHEA